MKNFVMLSAILSTMALSGMAHAADFSASTAPTQQSQAVMVAPSGDATATPKSSGFLKGGARIVPDNSPAPAPVPGKAFKKSDQGYSNMSAYNVVNDQNKPITNDWSRPKDWRIGYKNKNRTPINQ